MTMRPFTYYLDSEVIDAARHLLKGTTTSLSSIINSLVAQFVLEQRKFMEENSGDPINNSDVETEKEGTKE